MKRNLTIGIFLGICAGLVQIPAMSPPSGQVAVSIQEIEPFPYCSMMHKGPYTDMEEVINNLMSLMQSQNIYPAGNMITIYHTDPNQENPMDSEWEVGFPVTAQTSVVQEPLQKKQWTAATVVSAVHVGPYENTGDTIDAMFEWMEENGYAQDGPILGKYLNMPNEVSPSQLKTEIWIACRKE